MIVSAKDLTIEDKDAPKGAEGYSSTAYAARARAQRVADEPQVRMRRERGADGRSGRRRAAEGELSPSFTRPQVGLP